MDHLFKWASGCALGMALCAGAQAELIDSVRAGDNAYLISETHLYVYDSVSETTDSLALEMAPVAVDAAADGVFVAYPSKVEKRDFDGSLLSDASGLISHNLNQATDMLVHDTTLYAAILDGKAIWPLSTSNLDAVGGAPYMVLQEPLKRLVAYPENGTGPLQALYSPAGSDLTRLSFPVAFDADDIAQSERFAIPPGQQLEVPENIFFLEGATGDTILMDNGSLWSLDGTYHGWIAGREFHFLDQAEDDNWSLVRDKVIACEPEELRTWGSDLIHYDHSLRFDSREKAGTPEVLFDVVHVWGAGANPGSHLFRESAPGTLQVSASARADGQAYDDGKVPFSVSAGAGLSGYQLQQGVKSRHVALNDDHTLAYVLHQGNATCQSMVRVYNLATNTWQSTIPLRWRADALAVVGGANPDISDDQLAVVYEVAYDKYGRSDPLATFIDLNAGVQEEDASLDFADYGSSHHALSTVEASRHAVLFQLEVASQSDFSVITGYGPSGGLDTYIHTDSQSGQWSEIDGWDSRAVLGEAAGLALKAGDDLSLLNFTEDETSFSFGAVYDNGVLNETVDSVEAPLVASKDQTLFALNLPEESAALFDKNGPAYDEGKPQDFLPALLGAATWSETTQGSAGYYALYNLNGGDNEGTTASVLQRWLLTLGSDGHATFSPAGEGSLAGLPVRSDIVDTANDDLLLTTVYQGQYRFTPVSSDLSDAPNFEGSSDPSAGGGDSSGDGGTDTPVSGSGFSSGGGGSLGLLSGLLGVLYFRSRKRRN
ncbi:hypothetical protein [uncultured Alcanivorax sp.]|uniref:hypothetical protein n=1 Tax=uncultured Alcanivorax sp. TaxID=191215 RepID=UPI0030DCC988